MDVFSQKKGSVAAYLRSLRARAAGKERKTPERQRIGLTETKSNMDYFFFYFYNYVPIVKKLFSN